MGFESLTSLDLNLSSELSLLTVPNPNIRPSGLKSFRIRLKSRLVDWTAVGKWVGSKLEEFSVAVDSFYTYYDVEGLIHLGLFTSMVIPSRATLKTIELLNVGCEKEEISSDNPKNYFPNLQRLTMTSNSANLNRFFTTAECPNLQEFYLYSTHKQDRRASKLLLIKMLKIYDSRLTRLAFVIEEDKSNFKPPPDNLSFSFPNLKALRIEGQSSSIAKWFSKFEYPSLVVLGEDEFEHYDLFKNQAPNLKEPLYKYEISESGKKKLVPRHTST